MASRIGLMIGIFLVALSLNAQAQSVQDEDEVVDTSKLKLPYRYEIGRGLLETVQVLQRWYGWRVTFEEARLLHPDDVIDISYKLSPKAAPGTKAFTQNAHPFSFKLPKRAAGESEPDRLETLNRMVEAYNKSGNPGRFAVIRAGATTHIVPIMVKDKTGKLVPSPSILDVPVTVDGAETSFAQFMVNILHQVSQQIGREVAFGGGANNIENNNRVRPVPGMRTAREALTKMFEEVQGRAAAVGTHYTLSWQIRYSLSDDFYTFNVSTFGRPERAPVTLNANQ